MSANTSTAPPPAATVNGAPASAVDYVRALAPEAKEAVLVALLQELIEINGGGHGLIPIDTPDGKSLGYYVPPRAAKERYERLIAELPPDVRAEITKPLPPDF